MCRNKDSKGNVIPLKRRYVIALARAHDDNYSIILYNEENGKN